MRRRGAGLGLIDPVVDMRRRAAQSSLSLLGMAGRAIDPGAAETSTGAVRLNSIEVKRRLSTLTWGERHLRARAGRNRHLRARAGRNRRLRAMRAESNLRARTGAGMHGRNGIPRDASNTRSPTGARLTHRLLGGRVTRGLTRRRRRGRPRGDSLLSGQSVARKRRRMDMAVTGADTMRRAVAAGAGRSAMIGVHRCTGATRRAVLSRRRTTRVEAGRRSGAARGPARATSATGRRIGARARGITMGAGRGCTIGGAPRGRSMVTTIATDRDPWRAGVLRPNEVMAGAGSRRAARGSRTVDALRPSAEREDRRSRARVAGVDKSSSSARRRFRPSCASACVRGARSKSSSTCNAK
jgi:hypothetical protein